MIRNNAIDLPSRRRNHMLPRIDGPNVERLAGLLAFGDEGLTVSTDEGVEAHGKGRNMREEMTASEGKGETNVGEAGVGHEATSEFDETGVPEADDAVRSFGLDDLIGKERERTDEEPASSRNRAEPTRCRA